MEGLEISENYLSKVNLNKDFRIDSQFYTKAPKHNPNLNYIKIGKVIKQSQYGLSIEMNEEGQGFPIYRMNEIHDMLCDLSVDKYADISNAEYDKFALHDGDVLFNRTNSFEWVGRTGIYYQNDDIRRTFASYLVKFIPDEHIILPEYLCAFLNSKFGVWDIKRRARQSINQTNVNPEEVKEIEIPILDIAIQKEIQNSLRKANDYRVASRLQYIEAENKLKEELGINDFAPDSNTINIKQIKESFLASGRLDAEYYSKKYASYLDLIKSYKNGYCTLPQMCDIAEQNYSPIHDKVYKYIELSNISGLGDIKGFSQLIGAELPSRARRVVHTGDVIISSIEGSLQCIALVDANYDSALCSTGFYVLKPRLINPETLLVLFKSEPMQNLLKQQCSGTILTSINYDDLKNIIVPNINKSVQEEIADYIQKSVSLRQQAKQLLEDAKLKVEVAVTGGGDNQIVTEYNRMIEQSTYYYRLAEWTLLEELYADKWVATAFVNYSIKPFTVCQTTGRLDAEYYQLKYDVLFEKLSHYRCNTIREITTIKKSIEPGSDAYCNEGVPFVRVSDMTKFGITEPAVFLSRNNFNVSELHPKKDTILLSKDGSVGIAYKVEEDMDCITSGALLHLNVYNKNYLPDYLTLVLNSLVVQLQAERDSNGAIIQHWKPSEIEQVVIPYLPMETQRVIATKVQQSFALRSESKHLLAEAKQLVEQEIENQ